MTMNSRVKTVANKAVISVMFFLISVVYCALCTSSLCMAQNESSENESNEVSENESDAVSENTVENESEDASEGIEGDLEVDSPSCILMEAGSGQVLYEKDCDNAMAPASVTKVMTLLLIFDAMEDGQFTLDDTVTVSEHAASMGGSQCFFETGEQQTVEDMIKCIIIASGNDAAVAMSEKVAGSETAFVDMMNDKAKELGMENTTFKNACGLDTDGHVTTARDIALMSRELITKYPEILDYSGIWMDSIIHKTARGESQFDLVNTNKFLNMYTGATGLKTGFTSTAKYCMSATAERDGIQLIAVIMGAETKDIRNSDACTLLDYGYSRCTKYTDIQILQEDKISIDRGAGEYVTIDTDDVFESILFGDETAASVTKKLELEKNLTAPVYKGDVVGQMKYYAGDRLMGAVDIAAAETVEAMSMKYALLSVLRRQFSY